MSTPAKPAPEKKLEAVKIKPQPIVRKTLREMTRERLFKEIEIK